MPSFICWARFRIRPASCACPGSGRRYILEDGSGRLLFEHRNLDLVVLHARAAVPSTSWLMVRMITVWCAVRSVFHEKLEPMLAETEELLVQLAPQLAAFA